MVSSPLALLALGIAATATVAAAQNASCGIAQIDGCTARGVVKNINGVDTYFTYPSSGVAPENKTIIYVTDIYGLPAASNQLLADHIADAQYNVVMPDLFNGDPIPTTTPEAGLNLTAWQARHPASTVDPIMESTIAYIRGELGVKRLGGVGYCFGGKFVPRFMASGKGIDLGFVAHPANLTAAEIMGIVGGISVAAGQLDTIFNKTLRRAAVDILDADNATYELNLYSQAPHGFAVRPNVSVPIQVYAKEEAYIQAVSWFRAWL